MHPTPKKDGRDSRIKHIFQDAAELPQSERAQYLSEACGNDDTLRQELDRLLVAFDETGGLFAGTVPGAFFLDRTTRNMFSGGDKVGRFTVVRLVGVGGM